MARLVITAPAPVTVGGYTYTFKRGDVIEAQSALATAIGASARAANSGPDVCGEFDVSNATP